MACLDEALIVDLLSGALSPEDEANAKRHMDGCDACRELVAELARGMSPAERPSSAPNPDHTGPLARGNTIGRYVIVDVVGAGGMGVVYAAYDPELDRKVAVKLLRRDLSAETKGASVGDLGKRLLREAKAMAKLSHPNVVAVHDAGTTRDGQVFVAMEFVNGTSLGKWLHAKKRAWSEVLDVYTQAGRGLSAAHAAGLVHRDFKPENVMIEADATGGVARVLVTDFGLARVAAERPSTTDSVKFAIGQPRRSEAELSQEGVLAGTPAYMAPEQFTGAPANVLTDQFSFCVALYEGLYGERPFEARGFEDLVEAVLAGRMKEPPKDSLVPARVRAAIRRGLSVRPDQRFANMSELLGALRPKVPFKLKRRFIVAFSVVGIALAGMLGYRGALRGQLGVCTGAERKLAGVWDESRKAQVRSAFERSDKSFAMDAWRGVERALDGYARGWAAMRTDACEATRLRGEQSEEMLDRRVECLDAHLRQLSALTKLLSEADGEVVSRAVEASLALPSHSECANTAALKAGVKPPADRAKADLVRNARSRLARVKALEDAGKYVEARAAAEPVVTEARQSGYLPLEAEALAQAGRLAGRLEDDAKAERELREAAEAALASGHDAIAARAFTDLVYYIGHKTARYDDATHWSRYAALAIERLGGSDELEADRLETFSIILWKQGKPYEALAVLERALLLYKQTLGVDHVKVARTLDGIATVYADLGRPDQAYDLDEQAVAIAERALGKNHPQISMYLNNEGNGLLLQGRYAEALEKLRRALDVTEKTMGAMHPDTIPPLDSLGGVLTLMGRTDEALAYLQRAKALAAKVGRTVTPDYASVLSDIGQAEFARGRADLARESQNEALSVIEKLFGKTHPEYAATLARLAEADLALGKDKDALAAATQAFAIVDRGDASSAATRVLVALGHAQTRAGNASEAIAPLERAVKTAEARHGDPRDLADARFALAQALWAAGQQKDRARALANEARATFEKETWFKERLSAVDAWLADKDGRVTRAPDKERSAPR